MGCTVRNKCTFFDGGWMRGSSGWGDYGHGDNWVPKLDYMLWHKYIDIDSEQNREKTCYYRKKTLEYGRA